MSRLLVWPVVLLVVALVGTGDCSNVAGKWFWESSQKIRYYDYSGKHNIHTPCDSEGGKVAVILAADEGSDLENLEISNNYAWIGLNDRATGGTYVWENETPFDSSVNYHKFSNPLVDYSVNYDCTRVNADHSWEIADCRWNFAVVCECIGSGSYINATNTYDVCCGSEIDGVDRLCWNDLGDRCLSGECENEKGQYCGDDAICGGYNAQCTVDDDCYCGPFCSCDNHKCRVAKSKIFFRTDTQTTWNDADELCHTERNIGRDVTSARIALLKNEGESYLADQVSEGYEWIGLSDVESNNVWIWMDDSTPVYTDWRDGYPRNNNDDCGILNDYGEWENRRCDNDRRVLCQCTESGVYIDVTNAYDVCCYETMDDGLCISDLGGQCRDESDCIDNIDCSESDSTCGGLNAFCTKDTHCHCGPFCKCNDNKCSHTPLGLTFFATSQKKLDWVLADYSCQQGNGDVIKTGRLALLKTQAHQYATLDVVRNADADLWIGLSDLDANNEWQWLDGTAIAVDDYTNWYPFSDDYECANIRSQDYEWDDYSCCSTLYALCQCTENGVVVHAGNYDVCCYGSVASGKCLSDTGEPCDDDSHCADAECGLDGICGGDGAACKNTDDCYCGDFCLCIDGQCAEWPQQIMFAASSTSDWYTADSKCLSGDDDDIVMGRLVLIKDAYEQSLAAEIWEQSHDGDDMWIGCSDEATEGVWKWEDGTDLVYTKWGSGEPSGENCGAFFDYKPEWNDIRCHWGNRKAICECLNSGVEYDPLGYDVCCYSEDDTVTPPRCVSNDGQPCQYDFMCKESSFCANGLCQSAV